MPQEADTMTTLFNKLKAATDQREFLVSRVNISDLTMLQGFAELDGDDELAYLIWEVRNV